MVNNKKKAKPIGLALRHAIDRTLEKAGVDEFWLSLNSFEVLTPRQIREIKNGYACSDLTDKYNLRYVAKSMPGSAFTGDEQYWLVITKK